MAEPSNENPPASNPDLAIPVNNVKEDNQTKKSRSKSLLLFTLFIILIALLWFCYWFFYLRFEESTDDAYANGNFVNVNSVVSGAVIGFFADNTDFVPEGKLLVQLDSTAQKIMYEKELATLASIVLQIRQLYNNVEIQQANVKNKKIVLDRAQFDYNNRLKLRETNPQAVANEDFVHSEHDQSTAELDLKQAQAQLEVALSAVGNSTPETHPLIEQQKETIRQAFYQLQHCSIYASTTGFIAQRSVDVGQWITPLTSLMAIIPTDYVWVDANFKETQLSKMRIGQPSVVWFDLYGSKVEYKGQVIGVASGTGSIFSLIPPQNATGNWIKIVQRLPVRISLDPNQVKKFPVRLGISAQVTVDITNQDLPILSSIAPSKAVASTDVFNINLKEVNELMEKIIQENLKNTQL